MEVIKTLHDTTTSARNTVDSIKTTLGKARSALTSKTFLGTMFAGSVVTANFTASKIAMFDVPFFGPAAVPAGFLGLGTAFLCSDLLSELHGAEEAHKTVTSAVGALGAAYALAYASVAMPAAPFYGDSEAFRTIMMGSTPIVASSIITTLVSQNLDVSVFHKVREMTGDGHKWARNLISTLTSQAVDTTLFITLAFVALPALMGSDATVPLSAAASMIVAQYLVKVGVAALDTPLFYALSE